MVKCNFCVSTRPCVEKTNESYLDMLCMIIPNFNSEEYTNANICEQCDTLVTDIFNFKSSCFELEDSLYNYKTEDAAEIDLEKLVGLTSFSKGKLCRSCLEVIEDDSFVNLHLDDSLLREYKRKCLSDLDLFLTKEPVMCMRCANMLEKYFIFLQYFEKYNETLKYKTKPTIVAIETNKNCPVIERQPLFQISEPNNSQQRFSDDENDNEDVSLSNENFEDVKEEISIEDHVLENPENFSNTINDTGGLVMQNKNCDIGNKSYEAEISSNNNNNSKNNEVLEIVKETSSKINDKSDKNGSQLCGNENRIIINQLAEKSQDFSVKESDNSTNKSNNNKRKRTPVIVSTIDEDSTNTPTGSSTSESDVSRSSSNKGKKRKSKRLVASKRNYHENDSDFIPEMESESDSDYLDNCNSGKKKRRNTLNFHCRYCPHKETNSDRLNSHMSVCRSRSATNIERKLFAQVSPQSGKQGGTGMKVSKKRKSLQPGIIRSNPILSSLLTDSDSDSVDSETETLLKSLLKIHQTLPDPRKSNLQKFTKTDQNFLLQKLTLHPALPEPTLVILKKIADAKKNRNVAQQKTQRKKTVAVTTRATGIQQSDIVIQIDTAPEQNTRTKLNPPQFLSRPSSNLFVAYPQIGTVPNQQLVIWPEQASTAATPGPSVINSIPNVATCVSHKEYYSITSTTTSAKPILLTSPATSETAPHISDNMKSLILEFLKDKYSHHPNIIEAFDRNYQVSVSKQQPFVNSIESCIDLTLDDPNDPDQLGTVVEEVILPNVVADENFDGTVDADPLSLDTTVTAPVDPVGKDAEAKKVDRIINISSVITIPAVDNNSSNSKSATAPTILKDTPTTDGINKNNESKDNSEINTVMSDLEQVLACPDINKSKSVETTRNNLSSVTDAVISDLKQVPAAPLTNKSKSIDLKATRNNSERSKLTDTDDVQNSLEPEAESDEEIRNKNERLLIKSLLSNSAAKDVPSDISKKNGAPMVNQDNIIFLRDLLIGQMKLDEYNQYQSNQQLPSISKRTVDVTSERNRPDDSLPSISSATKEIDDNRSQENQAVDPSPLKSTATADVTKEIENQPSQNGPSNPLPSISRTTADVTMEIDDNQPNLNRPADEQPSISNATAVVTIQNDDNQSISTATADVTKEMHEKQPSRNGPTDPLPSTSSATADVTMEIVDNQPKRNVPADQQPSISSATADVTIQNDDNQSISNLTVGVTKIHENQPSQNGPTDPLPSTSTATADLTMEIVDNQPNRNRPVDQQPSISIATADVTIQNDDNLSISTATADVTKIHENQPSQNVHTDPLPSTSTATADVTMETGDNRPVNPPPSTPTATADLTIEIDDDQPATSDLTTKKVDDRSKVRRLDILPPISSRTTDVTIELDSDGDISSVKEPIDGIRLLATSREEMRNRISQYSKKVNSENDTNKKVVTMALNNHLSCPFELAIFKCDTCAYNTRFFRLIEEHCLQHFSVFHKTDTYICMHCSRRFEEKSQLATHLQTEHAQFFYTLWFWCVNCTTPFSKHTDVLRHNKQCPKKNLSVNLFKSNHTVFCMICYFETSVVEKARVHSRTCVTRRVRPVEVIELE